MNGTADSVMKGSRETTLLLVLHIGKVKKIVSTNLVLTGILQRI